MSSSLGQGRKSSPTVDLKLVGILSVGILSGWDFVRRGFVRWDFVRWDFVLQLPTPCFFVDIFLMYLRIKITLKVIFCLSFVYIYVTLHFDTLKILLLCHNTFFQ